MKARPIVIAAALTLSAGACRRHATPGPSPSSPTGAAPGPRGAGNGAGPQPAGTTPTTPDSPSNQQVQITGSATGPSSVVSVPPTPATGCPATMPFAALGPGTVHNNTVAQNETWTLEGSPHRLPSGITINSGASLTIAPCALVLLAHDQAVAVGDGGALMAVGDAQHPIRFGSDNPSPQPGDWAGVSYDPHARMTSRLAYVTVEHAGGGGEPGAIRSALVGLDVQNVTIRAARAYGVRVLDGGTFAQTSVALTVTGTVAGDADSTGAVGFDSAESLRTLPSGTYTGNAVDEVTVGWDDADVRTTGIWRNPGVRYHFNHSARIQGPTGPVITIAPGAQLAFDHSTGVTVGVDAEGGLIADGQSDQTRIVFTTAGSDRSPGVWEGINLGARFNRSTSRIAFATVEYGGEHAVGNVCAWTGGDGDVALISISGQPAAAQLINHVRFVGAPAEGSSIAPLWSGTAVNFADPALGNEFTQAGAACHVAPTRSAAGDCAETAACL